jgi:transcriptional regulator NrdR family protein
MSKEYWVCVIGPVERKELPMGADGPPRAAVQAAIIKMIGRQPHECGSGWGCTERVKKAILNAWSDSQYYDNEDESKIRKARKTMAKAFQKDPDFKQGYIDNVACLIMDRIPGFKKDKVKRELIARDILSLIFED